jgi:hypothetical protein
MVAVMAQVFFPALACSKGAASQGLRMSVTVFKRTLWNRGAQ